jgi:hypothetical protein
MSATAPGCRPYGRAYVTAEKWASSRGTPSCVRMKPGNIWIRELKTAE